MPVLKYYHINHKDKWHCVDEDQIPKDARYESVLYVKYRAEDIEVSGEEQEYWGPFYLDLDVSTDEDNFLGIGFADVREILQYMTMNFGLTSTDYRLYASGGKGFHIEFNPYLFMTKEFKKMLPIRYRAMAARLKQDIGQHLHIDMGVYSQGKGRQWRKTNVERENGNYKVWLPAIIGITVDEIAELIKQPGPVPPKFEKTQTNQLFVSWFMSTKKLVDMAKTSDPVPIEVIKDSETPECVVKLAQNKDIKGNVNSNLIAMQSISYGLARSWTEDQIVSYNNKLIMEYRSSQYKTPAAFEDHFRGLYDYAKEAPEKFKFGCKMMLSCVNNIDCSSCQIKIGEAQANYGSIFIKDGGYFMVGEQPDQPPKELTNFTLKWLRQIEDEEGEVHLEFLILNPTSPDTYKPKVFDSRIFDSKNNFMRVTDIYSTFKGSDKELQMLKLAVAHLNNPKKMREIGYTGLIWQNEEWHYATIDGSMSLNGTIDLIKTNVNITLANNTRLNFDGEEPTPDEIIRVITTLIEVNKPEIIMPLIAWFFNAFFNPHAQFANETSPSLFITGLHGSGKTQTAIQLHRLFAPIRPAFPSISATTAFSMNKYASSTNLMPLVFDEFKPSANAGKNNEVGQVSQAIRSSYNKAFESRGTSTRNIDQTPFYAPLAIIGEQQLNEGAISDRIILVQMDKSLHTEASTAALEELKLLPVEKVGAQFLEFVMRVSPKEYINSVLTYDKSLEIDFPGIFDSRPRRNLANLSTAMDFVQQYVLLYTGDERLVDSLEEKLQIYKDSFKTEAMAVHNEIRRMDDISNILNLFNDIADLTDMGIGDLVLMPNKHYVVSKGVIFFDIFACYKNISMYIKKYDLGVYLTDRTSFIAQINHKDYIAESARKSDRIVAGKKRVTVGVSILKAQQNNINFDNFKGVDYD